MNTRLGKLTRNILKSAILLGAISSPALAATGDPQIKTDDLWYPGELSCSTFQRLFKTEAQAYTRVTGKPVVSDEDKALAAWFWRNTHYWHGEEGQRDCYNEQKFGGDKSRDYWTGLFADGMALCGTTHAQWCAEMDALLGHCRSRVVGVNGHNSFEVYLTGGAYGSGQWALLDHDISTIIYSPDGSRLLSLPEIVPNFRQLANPAFKPARDHGWYISGLEDNDARGVYTQVNTAEYLAGYAAAPPMVNLRSGESFRRYLEPGLDDGKTFVFWGRNYNIGIPGPTRDRTWVNQPQKMYESKHGTGAKNGQVRYANAVYTYTPNFADGSYKQGVIDESADHVTFEFYSPYVIAATPPNSGAWGIYDTGCTNGLVLHGKATCPVQISVDQGKTWQDAGAFADGLDLTDRVKGFQQYFLKFGAGAASLKEAGLSWRTICQANVAVIPHLHDGENTITYLAGGKAIVAAGPTLDQAAAHVVDGKMNSKTVTLELTAPRGAMPVAIHAAAWQASGSPPAAVSYNIDYSVDGGTSWQPVVKDWKIERRKPEPGDFWSQSFTWGDVDLKGATAGKPVRIRFSNDGGKTFRKVEAYLVYDEKDATATDVTFAWKNAAGELKTATHAYPAATGAEDATWHFDPGEKVQTAWVEMKSK
ncbi:MAG TPA: hypothetical protein VFE47_00375 [Tepidisphaeraceae bacterium]|jgi:hypothetical protein|nr:hypothetical protein [Tepidisphaeraceae bacterium]